MYYLSATVGTILGLAFAMGVLYLETGIPGGISLLAAAQAAPGAAILAFVMAFALKPLRMRSVSWWKFLTLSTVAAGVPAGVINLQFTRMIARMGFALSPDFLFTDSQLWPAALAGGFGLGMGVGVVMLATVRSKG